MASIRPVLEENYKATGLVGFDAQFLAITEAAAVVAGRISCGGAGPSLHIHPCDQYYFMLSGSMKIRLGREVHEANAGSLVAIPAGLPHCNWNDREMDEVHLELLAPMIRPGQQHFTFVDSVDDGRTTARAGYVMAADGEFAVDPTEPGVRRRRLSSPEDPRAALCITLVERSGAAVGSRRIRAVDQLMFLVGGQLSAEIGAQPATLLSAYTLMVVSSGVPYRISHYGAGPARYLEIAATAPPELDEPVEVELNVLAAPTA